MFSYGLLSCYLNFDINAQNALPAVIALAKYWLITIKYDDTNNIIGRSMKATTPTVSLGEV